MISYFPQQFIASKQPSLWHLSVLSTPNWTSGWPVIRGNISLHWVLMRAWITHALVSWRELWQLTFHCSQTNMTKYSIRVPLISLHMRIQTLKMTPVKQCHTVSKGHHHNGDQATRRSHIFGSISGRQFGDMDEAPRLFIARSFSQCVLKWRLSTVFSYLQPFR